VTAGKTHGEGTFLHNEESMSEKKSIQVSGGIGFGGLLTILFIGLKLTGYINWSWLWVLSPMWLPVAIFLAFMGFCLLMAGLCTALIAILERYCK